MLRKFYISPAELNLHPNELDRIMRPIYGLPDAGEYCPDKFSTHLRVHCNYKKATTDVFFWMKTCNSTPSAIAATLVDEVLLYTAPDELI